MATNTTKTAFLDFTSAGGVLKCNGKRIHIKGVSWFGMEWNDRSLHGLWAVGFDTLLKVLVDNNFNAVRLPLSAEFAEEMDTKPAVTITPDKNADLVGLTCGEFLERIVKKFANAGILVMFDMQFFKSSGDIPEVWYQDGFPETRVTAAWVTLVKRFSKYWNFFACDLKNEPHGKASWGDNNPLTDWAPAAERIGNAILDVCPRLLIYVEGVEGFKPVDSWWGGYLGYMRSNNRPINLKVPGRLVYSPHVYGPSVWPKRMFQIQEFPYNMPPQWEEQWAYIKTLGGAAVCIGEWGGMATNTGEGDQYRPDLIWHHALAEFLVKNDLRDTFYWCLNANGGDTGGLVGADWATPVPQKLEAIAYVCPNATSFRGGTDTKPPVPNTPTNPQPLTPWTSVLAKLQPMGSTSSTSSINTNTPATKPPATTPITPAPIPITPTPTPPAPTPNPSAPTPATPMISPTPPVIQPPPPPVDPNSTGSTSNAVTIEMIELSGWVENGAKVYRHDVKITNGGTSTLGAAFKIAETVPEAEITNLWSMIKIGTAEQWGLPAWILDYGGLKPGQSHTFGCTTKNAVPAFRVIAKG